MLMLVSLLLLVVAPREKDINQKIIMLERETICPALHTRQGYFSVLSFEFSLFQTRLRAGMAGWLGSVLANHQTAMHGGEKESFIIKTSARTLVLLIKGILRGFLPSSPSAGCLYCY